MWEELLTHFLEQNEILFTMYKHGWNDIVLYLLVMILIPIPFQHLGMDVILNMFHCLLDLTLHNSTKEDNHALSLSLYLSLSLSLSETLTSRKQ